MSSLLLPAREIFRRRKGEAMARTSTTDECATTIEAAPNPAPNPPSPDNIAELRLQPVDLALMAERIYASFDRLEKDVDRLRDEIRDIRIELRALQQQRQSGGS